jgi:hypothetical protein
LKFASDFKFLIYWSQVPIFAFCFMKAQIVKLFLLLSLFVAWSASTALACGNPDDDHISKFHHDHGHNSGAHAHEIAQNHRRCLDNSEHCNQEKSGRPSSEGQDGHCHCPGCGTTFHTPLIFAPAELTISNRLFYDKSAARQAFYFADHLPEAVYFPIWQPPKLVA